MQLKQRQPAPFGKEGCLKGLVTDQKENIPNHKNRYVYNLGVNYLPIDLQVRK